MSFAPLIDHNEIKGSRNLHVLTLYRSQLCTGLIARLVRQDKFNRIANSDEMIAQTVEKYEVPLTPLIAIKLSGNFLIIAEIRVGASVLGETPHTSIQRP